MRLKRIKIAREEDQRRLIQLQQSLGPEIDFDNVESQIKELCKKIKRNLKKCTFAEKRQAINDLDVS